MEGYPSHLSLAALCLDLKSVIGVEKKLEYGSIYSIDEDQRKVMGGSGRLWAKVREQDNLGYGGQSRGIGEWFYVLGVCMDQRWL